MKSIVIILFCLTWLQRNRSMFSGVAILWGPLIWFIFSKFYWAIQIAVMVWPRQVTLKQASVLVFRARFESFEYLFLFMYLYLFKNMYDICVQAVEIFERFSYFFSKGSIAKKSSNVNFILREGGGPQKVGFFGFKDLFKNNPVLVMVM